MRRITTIVFLLRDEQVCLGKKKAGFGAGYWNGFGGKVETDEPLLEAAVREVKEESNVDVLRDALIHVATLEFFFDDGSEVEAHVFLVHTFTGEPIETDEMLPQWFGFSDVPFSEMWDADKDWVPRVLRGEQLRGKVWFDESGVSAEKKEWAAF